MVSFVNVTSKQRKSEGIVRLRKSHGWKKLLKGKTEEFSINILALQTMHKFEIGNSLQVLLPCGHVRAMYAIYTGDEGQNICFVPLPKDDMTHIMWKNFRKRFKDKV